MFNKTNRQQKELLDKAILTYQVKLLEEDFKGKEDQREIIDRLEQLVEIRDIMLNSEKDVLMETVLPIVLSGGLQLGGIFMVLRFEKVDVITSKGFQMASGLFKRV